MNIERLLQIVTTELGRDLMVLEEKLETAINSESDIDTKLSVIKHTLREIVLAESMLVKWRNFTTAPQAPNENNEGHP